MTTNPHQTLRTFVSSIRGDITNDDAFGQHLTRLAQRASRAGANGVFRRVRALHDAVIGCGGTLPEARAWTSQSLRWLQNGKAIDQKFARYEFDPQAATAMNALLKFVSGLPEDLLTAARPPLPFGSPFRPAFGTKPVSPTAPPSPLTPPASPAPVAAPSPFARPPTPPAPAATAPNSPFNRPGGAPKPQPTFGRPTPPVAVPFGKPPTPPARPGGLFGRPLSPPSVPDLPGYIAVCFDALAVTADPPTSDLSALNWWESLASGAPISNTPEPEKSISPEPELPTDLKGLYELLCMTSEPNKIITLLQRIGALNDLHAVELIYNLWRGTGIEKQLPIKFAIMGGDVGVAGLMTLLPVDAGQRSFFLGALTGLVRNGNLNDTSRALLWRIAVAESSPEVVYCDAALTLLAAIGTSEAQAILWEHASHADVSHRRDAVASLIRCGLTDRLPELLKALSELMAPEQPNELTVGIPFEALESILRSGRPVLAQSALRLIGYIDDPRVVPLLIEQLARRIPALREEALKHLRRLKATSAADAVARLISRDPTLREAAAEALCDWNDARCLPTLIESVMNLKDAPQIVDLIKRLDKLAHPVYQTWLLNGIDKLIEASELDLESNLIGAIDLLVELNSTCLQPLLARLIDYPSVPVRLAVAKALPNVAGEWALEALQKLVRDTAAVVSYRAAEQCKAADFGRKLLASRNELERVLGVRIAWNAGDSVALLDCLSDESAAVRDLAITALGHLRAAEAVEPLRRFLEQGDRLDLWTQNTAVLAWRSLAKMGAVAAVQPATTMTLASA